MLRLSDKFDIYRAKNEFLLYTVLTQVTSCSQNSSYVLTYDTCSLLVSLENLIYRRDMFLSGLSHYIVVYNSQWPRYPLTRLFKGTLQDCSLGEKREQSKRRWKIRVTNDPETAFGNVTEKVHGET